MPGSLDSARQWTHAALGMADALIREGFDEAAAHAYAVAGALDCWEDEHAS